MQFLPIEITKEVKKERMRELERQLSKYFIGVSNHENIECPFCHYVSKNNRTSGKIFINPNGKCFKCFSCGIWRKIL